MTQQEFNAELNKWRLGRGVDEELHWSIQLILHLNIVEYSHYSSLICTAQAEVQNIMQCNQAKRHWPLGGNYNCCSEHSKPSKSVTHHVKLLLRA